MEAPPAPAASSAPAATAQAPPVASPSVPPASPATRKVSTRVVIIKKDGDDGARLSLESGQYTFGSNLTCQVRLKPEFVTGIADIHAKITISPVGSASVVNVSKVPGSVKIKRASGELEVGEEEVPLQHSDVITICTRSFRFEEVSPEEEAANGKRRADGDDSPRKKKQKKQNITKVPGARKSTTGLSKWVEASLKVLQKEGRPMNIKEIAQCAIANGFVTEVGLTPWNSVTAELHRDIKNPNTPFKKFAAGVFGLKEHSYNP